MTDRLLRIATVMAATGLSKSTLYALQRARKFPQARRLSPRCVAWLSADVQAWIESRRPASQHEGFVNDLH